MSTRQHQPSSILRVAGDDTLPVPVYDCHVILSPADASGTIRGRVTSLPEITAHGQSEREVLQRIVREFKAALIRYRESGKLVPWPEPTEVPGPGESQRWIPVHL